MSTKMANFVEVTDRSKLVANKRYLFKRGTYWAVGDYNDYGRGVEHGNFNVDYYNDDNPLSQVSEIYEIED